MPDIMNNVQKNLIDGFRKKYKILILGATDASFRHYKDLKIQFHPLFNACQQVKFQKNLKSRLRKKLVLILGQKMACLPNFQQKITLIKQALHYLLVLTES